jgi:hypothetical protein
MLYMMRLALNALQDLPVHTSLVLCATACILLKQPITPHDLVRWAMDGVLPYYDAFARWVGSWVAW